MRGKTCVAPLLWGILLGVGTPAGAWTIGFTLVSESQPADTATFTLSDPLASLDVTGGVCVVDAVAGLTAALTATGTWTAYPLPVVTVADAGGAFVQTGVAGSWSLAYLSLYGYDGLDPAPTLAALGSSSLFGVDFASSAASPDFFVSADPATPGRYTLYDSSQASLDTPVLLSITVDPAAVPLPSSLLLLTLGLPASACLRRNLRRTTVSAQARRLSD